jgi:serine/threonine-protein kinase HipA
MNRKANIFLGNSLAGSLQEIDTGYLFVYNTEYVNNKDAKAISLTLPLTKTEYKSPVLFSFFDGLIPEGWLLDIAQENWKLNYKDRMGLLLACCKDCIGAVSVVAAK